MPEQFRVNEQVDSQPLQSLNQEEISQPESLEIKKELVEKSDKQHLTYYLQQFSEALACQDEQEKKVLLEQFQQKLCNAFVIKPEKIPDYYDDQTARAVIEDQKNSLKEWIDYLAEAQTSDSLKGYALRAILGMGSYDGKKHKFEERRAKTISPFPDINEDALALSFGLLGQTLNDQF
jgi:hypothetical protein